MSSFHKFALLGVAGATITVSALVVGQLAATASSGLEVGSGTCRSPTHASACRTTSSPLG